MKKIIASILVLCIILSTSISALVTSANDSKEQSIITTKYIDLSLSDRLVYKNQDNSDNNAIKNFKPGKSLTLTANNNSIGSVAVGGTDAKEYSKQITLEYTKGENFSGYFKVEEGKIYTVNVKYAAKATNSSKKLSVALVAANTPDGNDATATTLAGKIFDNINTWNENQVLSAVIDPSNTYVEAGDYLRIFVAGYGEVGIESVIIEEVDSSNADKVMTVNYNDGYCTRKQFTLTNKHIVPEFYGANDSVFDAWYTDSAFTSKSSAPEANGIYYAKWMSVTRYADLQNANRIVEKWDNATNSNLPYQNGNSLTVSNLENDGIKVVVSKSSSANYAAGATNVAFEGSNQLTLEYFDTDSSNLDGAYAGYVKLDPNKQYAITVDYDVTSFSSTAKLAVAAFSSNVSKNNGNVLAGNNNITSVGSYTTYGTLKAGGLVDCTYGGVNASGWKLRLVLSGSATFVIKSVRIQEIYTADATAGNAVGIQYVEEGKTFKAAAIKKDGKWILPTPALKGDVVDAQFEGWYKDASFTTALSTPVLNDTYYAKWSSITRNLDVKNFNKMAVSDSVLNLTSPTASKPLTITINGSNSDSAGQHVSLEYYDDDGNAATVKDENLNGYVRLLKGKLYAVSVKYKVTNVGATAPTIALMNSKNGLSWASDQKILGSATHSQKGEYVLSEIVGAGIDGAAENDRLRLAFNGQGTFEIESVTITEIYSNSNVYPVEYVDGNVKTTAFVTAGDELITPETREGYTFEGWYNSSNTEITSVSQLTSTTTPTTLTSKWLQASTEYDIDLTISQVLDNTVGSSTTVAMTVEPDNDNNDLLVDLNSGWNNIFRDAEGNLRTGVLWPDAYFALKLGESTTDPAHFVKLQKDYKYTVNVEYEVLSASAEYNPQIAIVKNNSTVSAGLNGSVVLNSNTHSAPGKYSLSAVVSNVDNVPLRLAFGGIGKINITSVKVNLEQKKDTSLVDITYIDGESSMSKFQKAGSDLYAPTKDGFRFVGWFTKAGEKVESTQNLTSSLTLYAKWTGVKTTEVDLTNSQIIKDKQGNTDTVVMEVTPDEDSKELTIDLTSGWNNIFRDTDGNLRTGTLAPDAIIALKYSKGSDPSDFIKLQKNFKYIVNVDYEVKSADNGYNPQIAIVRNSSQNSAQNNGTIALNSNSHSAPGEYSISAVVSNVDNIPLRLAFGGIGQIVIKKVTLLAVLASDDLLFDITYNNGESIVSDFRTEQESLKTPTNDGFTFVGWFTKEGDKVEDIVGVKYSLNLFAKWTGVKTAEIDLTFSEALRFKNNSDQTTMEIEADSDTKALNVKLNSGWNNIFEDNDGNLRDGDLYPDAILALKLGKGSEVSNYLKLQKAYNYIVNVEYEVVSANAEYNPQIAIVRNKTTNSTGINGAIVLNSNTHSTAGEYKLSAVVSNINNIPLRLAFGGLGEIVITKVTLSAVLANDKTLFDITYNDKESNYAYFRSEDDGLDVPVDDGFIFEGWFTKDDEKIDDIKGENKSFNLFAKWTGVKSFDIDLTCAEALKDKNASGESVMEIEDNAQDKSINISLNSGWNNIFKDADGEIRDGEVWPDAVLALKYNNANVTTSYVKFQKNYKYIVNVDYEVLSANSSYNPQIAIVRNKQTNSTGLNGSIVLNSNTHSTAGEYKLSAVVSDINNIPLRLAFGGLGEIVIKNIKVSAIAADDNKYIDVTYYDGESNFANFQLKNSDLYTPEQTDFSFEGWFTKDGDKVEDTQGVKDSLTVYAKWTGVKTDTVNLTYSESLKDKNGSDETVMTLKPNKNDKSLKVSLKSGWNNIFKDKDGNLRTDELWPDAVMALKYDKDTAPASYIKLQKNLKYVINVEYQVTAADASFNPQIAIVRNNQTNSTGLNGATVLNSNTHSTAGEYKLSAVVSDIDNIPLRLAFGGLGEVVIKSVTISKVLKEDENFITVTYYDGESNYTKFQKKNSELEKPEDTGFEFVGWFDANGERVEDTAGVADALTVYAKWTGINTFSVNPSDSEAIRYQNNSKQTVLEVEANDDKSLDVTLNSGWNNIFRDKNGNLRLKTKDSNGNYVQNVLWPDAILALKYDTGSEPSSYVKLQKNYDYVINIDYEVTSVYTDYAPQIAIVRNNQTNSTGINGSIALNANTHIEKGSYSISAYVDNIDNIPVRLAFGGIGKIVIKSITISYINTKDDNYIHVMYVDGDSNRTLFSTLGTSLGMPENDPTFKGWYKNAECIGKPIDFVSESTTVYAKRNLEAYSFNIDFDTKLQKDFYKSGNHTLSDFEKYGADAMVVKSLGTNKSSAVRLSYKRLDNDYSDYAVSTMVALYDTNVLEGEISDKRFMGKPNTQYELTFKYKVEETDDMSLELLVGKRNRGQSANGATNEFGSEVWKISDATQIGATITEKTDKWVEAKAYFTATSGWFPVIMLRTNNQGKSTETEGDLASVLIDDITVTEITPITEDTVLGVMDYEDYDAKTYESGSADSIIGNKYGINVTDKENHTKKGKKSLEITLMSDSLQYSGNTVVSVNKEPLRSERGSAYIVEFFVMSKTNIDGLIWGVNSVAGSYDSVTSKHKIEIRDKIDLKAKKWQKVTAYIPKLVGFEDAIGMFSIAFAANGYDGTNVYVDDISVKLQIESEVVNFVDSDNENPFNTTVQRGFSGQKFNTLPSVEKDGYLFDGWYDTADCNGKEYKVSDVFPEDCEEVTMYAKWIDASTVKAQDFTAGAFDIDTYDEGVEPYENVCETSEESIYGITNLGSSMSGAWVKDAGIYGNGTADYDGALSLSNDTYSKYMDANGRNAIALMNENGTRFAVVKGEKYSIKFDYVNGSTVGTSYIQAVISTGDGYRGFGYGKDQGLKNIAVHGTDSDYQTYQEYFVADFTGFVYITFATRTDDSAPYRQLYHRVYVDNVEIKRDADVKKIEFIADGNVHKTLYGKPGDKFQMFDAIQGDTRTTEFEGFYLEPEFKTRIEKYEFTNEDVQKVYIKYKEVEYNTASDFSSPIKLDFEDTKWLDNFYRQGKHMTYWMRGEANPEWQLISADKKNAYNGQNYMRLNGYTTYWNEAKFVLYDKKNPSGTMILEKGATYRVTLMSRCEDKYDIPKLTISLENPSSRYLLANNGNVALVGEVVEYKNGYMRYTADITVPETLTYLPSLAIRKNQNDLQSLYIDDVVVEKIIDCKVTFEENGGTEIDDVTIQVHEKLDDPGIPFREGYDFLGWFMDKKMTKAWDFENMTVESDMTLYAKWVESKAEVLPDFEDTTITTPENEEVTDSKVPNMLDGDEHEYPTNTIGNDEIATWIIILISVGGIVVLLGVGGLIWWLIARKKSKN